MRERKFRLWHKETGAFLKVFPYEWKDGVYTNGKPNKFFDNKFQFSEDNKECNRIEGKSVFLTIDGSVIGILPIDNLTHKTVDYSDEYIVSEFTGLKDKKGKDIFEGDILMTETDKPMVVTWSNKFASFCLNRDGWAFQHWFGEACNPENCEVIGDIYSNPELIK